MTDTPRAKVEALIAEQEERKLLSLTDHERDNLQLLADALTALLPLAYTETGETWRDLMDIARGRAEALNILLEGLQTRNEAAERRLAEVTAELDELRRRKRMVT